MSRGEQIMATITAHAPKGCDPSTDDFTVPFAIKLAEQDVEIAKLREALAPFASIAKQLQKSLKDDHKNTLHWAVPTVGDFRRARAAVDRTDR